MEMRCSKNGVGENLPRSKHEVFFVVLVSVSPDSFDIDLPGAARVGAGEFLSDLSLCSTAFGSTGASDLLFSPSFYVTHTQKDMCYACSLTLSHLTHSTNR